MTTGPTDKGRAGRDERATLGRLSYRCGSAVVRQCGSRQAARAWGKEKRPREQPSGSACERLRDSRLSALAGSSVRVVGSAHGEQRGTRDEGQVTRRKGTIRQREATCLIRPDEGQSVEVAAEVPLGSVTLPLPTAPQAHTPCTSFPLPRRREQSTAEHKQSTALHSTAERTWQVRCCCMHEPSTTKLNSLAPCCSRIAKLLIANCSCNSHLASPTTASSQTLEALSPVQPQPRHFCRATGCHDGS